MMKLAYITSVDLPSNAAQSTQILAMSEAFSKILGQDFILFSPKTKANEKISSVNLSPWIKIDLYENKSLLYLLFIFRALLFAKKNNFTYIYTRDIAVAILSIFFRLNSIYEIHKEPRSLPSKIIFFCINSFICFRNIKFIFISKALSQFYLKTYKIRNKYSVCHDGVFMDLYDKYRMISKKTLRRELNLPNVKIMLHSGSIHYGRGGELFEVIIKNFPDILFVQVGGEENDIEFWSVKYKKFKNILFIKRVNNEILVKYQMAADYLLYPLTKDCDTWWCASPLKLFEYLATGIPIFSSNIGSIMEILNQRCVFLFNPSNHSELSDILKKYQNNSTELKKRANVGMNIVRNNYTWPDRAKKILRFINEK